jgi:hypothetical protein
MGAVPKPCAVIPHFVQPDPDHPTKKSQSGPLSGSVRIRHSSVGYMSSLATPGCPVSPWKACRKNEGIIRVAMVFHGNFCNDIFPEFWVKERVEKEFGSGCSHVQLGL